ncbi:uncharacterized protein BHQ10_007298 [Talaromyces amestolkiae]|uniref:Pex N-terminal domain-containing protein n=1 Tax=Talaromyces amestolkiae TaxID=1196081 RepID=A0A364L664_TALAM|nr:uncharacterized protein BHQ10_007298 [Talaromyces amestolkiae]RAO71286.1 hypothetical protein BHQ10_007298 [Talaromyces amestolkiae]
MTSANFAAAQRRVLERRQRLELEAQTRHAEQQRASRINSAALEKLPGPLNRLAQSGFLIWDKVKGRDGTKPIFRVGQVDAELLDEELLGLLKGQVGEALKYFGAHARDEWSSEIQLALRAILFKLSIWDHDASYGASLQGLQYVDSRSKSVVSTPPTTWQKSLYGLFTVGGRYAWEKWESWLIERENGYDEPSTDIRLLSRITNLVSTTHSIAAFVSFLVFLVNGRYRTLIDRIIRIRLAPPSNQVSREVSFEYLNRQLVWHAFTEFLLFLLPLVGIGRWRRWIARAWKKTMDTLKASDDGNCATKEKQGQFAFLPERTCAICYQDQNPTSTSEADILGSASGGIIGSAQTDITNPYETIPCGCIYCFVCITEKLEAEEGEGWSCLRCGEIVKQCKPWNGDVLEEVPRSSSSGKVVGFAVAEDEEEPAIHGHEDETTADADEHDDNQLSDIVANDTLESSKTWSTIDRETSADEFESAT